jgi:hypothetical protein
LSSATVSYRARVNGRLRDPEGKWRDEMTQEMEVSITMENVHESDMLDKVKHSGDLIRKELFGNLAAAGGQVYNEREAVKE